MQHTDQLLNNINEGWHDFYMLLGTASAALVALLFVAASIGAGFLTPERSTATRTFMSPVVFHYSTTLLMSLIALIPAHTPISLTVGIAAVAVAGLAYTTMVLVGLARASITDIAEPVRLRPFPACRLSRHVGVCGTYAFTSPVWRRHSGGGIAASACRQHSQRLGSDAGFCATGGKQKIRYLIASVSVSRIINIFRSGHRRPSRKPALHPEAA
jgi:hypothetical protein